MGFDNVSYCPWCGGESETTMEQKGHTAFKAHKCDECETVFRVKVPTTTTELSWSEAN